MPRTGPTQWLISAQTDASSNDLPSRNTLATRFDLASTVSAATPCGGWTALAATPYGWLATLAATPCCGLRLSRRRRGGGGLSRRRRTGGWRLSRRRREGLDDSSARGRASSGRGARSTSSSARAGARRRRNGGPGRSGSTTWCSGDASRRRRGGESSFLLRAIGFETLHSAHANHPHGVAATSQHPTTSVCNGTTKLPRTGPTNPVGLRRPRYDHPPRGTVVC